MAEGRKVFRVSALHQAAGYSLEGELVTVSPSPGREGFWYASSARLGCGKDRPSPQEAIGYLLNNECFQQAGRSIVEEAAA